ncbi:MAG: formylglycine-generating enzyme family protein [Verrucomicrobia bacterium]|nr:formylglycine-generating enzyme family protein [Verrucomicrobiota bacterium]
MTAGCTTPGPQAVVEAGSDHPRVGPASALVYIPAGTLRMGDHSGAGYADERPVHEVSLDAFYLDRTEVTWAHWLEVYQWALGAGYEFEGSAAIEPPRAPDHPVCNVTWYDAVKWANARSEMMGRTPVYYTDAARSAVYRKGEIDPPAEAVDWEADGFRLPTEAEWEWAARGGLESQHYPWPSPGGQFAPHFDGGRANYWESGDPYDAEPVCATTPVGYYRGSQEPAGVDMANGYGLYDMAGNVAEWCWDWYDDRWYEAPEARAANTRGPARGPGRVIRGGSWISSDKYCRVSARYMSAPGFRCHCYGLRLVVSGLRDGG